MAQVTGIINWTHTITDVSLFGACSVTFPQGSAIISGKSQSERVRIEICLSLVFVWAQLQTEFKMKLTMRLKS